MLFCRDRTERAAIYILSTFAVALKEFSPGGVVLCGSDDVTAAYCAGMLGDAAIKWVQAVLCPVPPPQREDKCNLAYIKGNSVYNSVVIKMHLE